MDTEDHALTHDHAAFLAGSPNRIRVLRTLRERPGRGSDLAERCSLPRSTVHRCLDGVTTRGWARKADGDYRITPAGVLVLGAYEDLVETISIAAEHEGLLHHLGRVARTLPVGALSDATVIEATPESPHATMKHIEDVYAAISPGRFRGILPIVSHVFNEINRPLVEQGVEMDIVLDQSVLETARDTHPEAHELGVESGNFAIHVHPGSIPFGLMIFDDQRALVGAYDEQGNLRVCLDGTDTALVEWATETYKRYRRDSKPLGIGVAPEAQ